LEKFLKLSFTELCEAAKAKPRRSEAKKKKSGRTKDKAKIASVPVSAATPKPVHVSVSFQPHTPAQSPIPAGPPVKEEQILTRLIA
jgi:hypothetical protein